ncbi:MAG: hypothetical protein AB9819_01850 [Methanomassiliicoccales archaeon]
MSASARFDRTAIRFMAGVECMVLALVLLVPLMFPVKLIGAIGVPVVAVMTAFAIVLALVSFRLLYRREKESLDRPYVAPGKDSSGPRDGESALESKAETAKSFYFSDGVGTHLRRGGGRF